MNNNYGHRERLRKRFLSTGLNGFAEHEILELLLSFTVVRRDCKQISKEILLKYDNLYNFISSNFIPQQYDGTVKKFDTVHLTFVIKDNESGRS